MIDILYVSAAVASIFGLGVLVGRLSKRPDKYDEILKRLKIAKKMQRHETVFYSND